jgi:hypothetical protein
MRTAKLFFDRSLLSNCAQVGGDKYIKAMKTALPRIPFIAQAE